ncbi:M15 family metallopeptidase [Nannocystaceae bacterium ST9]
MAGYRRGSSLHYDITLKDELIVTMEAHGIQWGGRQGTPDIMHFDLRGDDFKSRRPENKPPKP